MKKIALALVLANVAAGTSFAFNPQPDPPAKQTLASQNVQNPGVIRGFNPQPEPPGVIRGVNPIPEPPGSQALPAVQH